MSITNYIIKLLGIKDENITFTDEQKEVKIKDVLYTKLFAKLTYEPSCCKACSVTNKKSLIRCGFKISIIKLLPTAGNPCLLSFKEAKIFMSKLIPTLFDKEPIQILF